MAISETLLFSFAPAAPNTRANATGANPSDADLTADAQGNLYGTTVYGGTAGTGAVYELVKGADGYTQQTLFSFAASNPDTGVNATGANPDSGVITDAQGNLYGATTFGGAAGTGTVYELVRGASGYTQQTLFSFAALDPDTGVNATGAGPSGRLIADAQGNLYGTAGGGGTGDSGTVYELVRGADGYTQQTLFSFAVRDNDNINATGSLPTGGLTADAQGNLYGATNTGGAAGTGAVYELVRGADGYTQQTLFSFAAQGAMGANATGANPVAGLTADAQGNLYGTTTSGGTAGTGAVYELVRGADGYTQQTLFSFAAAGPDGVANATGMSPIAGVTVDAQGNLFGTTQTGGAAGAGTVYELVRGAGGYSQQTLFSFATSTASGNATGAFPRSGLIADAQGDLYGTTSSGGASNTGAVYALAGSGFAVTCFVTGTQIRVRRAGVEADVEVEGLHVGDCAVTASGALRPITWIGHRVLDGAGRTLSHDQQPIRVRKGAFGPGLPARDLCLSPGHPVLVGADADDASGVLVPIMCLINGTSITREAVASVTYWHVELDAHDILLAEGLPAESYLDWGDRPFFTEGSDHALHHPDFVVPGLSARCRPVAIEGAEVEAERARLGAVFAAELSGHGAWEEADGDWLAA